MGIPSLTPQGGMELHRGVNINVREGTEVQSVMDGTVVRTGYNSAFGNYVVTQDEKGVPLKEHHKLLQKNYKMISLFRV